MTLEEIKTGESAIITALLNSEYTLKLTEMGFYPNKTITVMTKSWDAETIAIKMGHGAIMLRREETRCIIVRKCEESYDN